MLTDTIPLKGLGREAWKDQSLDAARLSDDGSGPTEGCSSKECPVQSSGSPILGRRGAQSFR